MPSESMDLPDSLAERLALLIGADEPSIPVVLTYRSSAESIGLKSPSLALQVARAFGRTMSGDDDLARVVFLDIETTGLNAGAGTLVFLVGLAYLEGNDIIVEQFFLHEPAAERVLLERLARRLREAQALVTFNGKSFDIPMLVGRYDLNRLADPIPSVHVDLLHPSRRIWGRRLRQASLGWLEAQILGRVRDRDVPGAEVPRLYFEFLHGGAIDPMARVLEHNRDDLFAMIGLAERIGRFLSDPRLAESSGPSDLLGLGTLFETLGKRDEARHCYAAALAGASSGERAEALFRLATLVDKAIDLDRAIELYTAVAHYPFERALLASVELAKIHEHRTGDHDQALAYAGRALALLDSAPRKRKAGLATGIALRIARLERKVKRRGPN